jgi:hypothetical protein
MSAGSKKKSKNGSENGQSCKATSEGDVCEAILDASCFWSAKPLLLLLHAVKPPNTYGIIGE